MPNEGLLNPLRQAIRRAMTRGRRGRLPVAAQPGDGLSAVLVTRDLRVRRLTPPAQTSLGISPADIGRTVTDLHLALPLPGLAAALAGAIDRGAAHYQEMQDARGRWLALRVQPSIAAQNQVDGAMMVLLEIDTLKRTQAEIAAARDYAANIVEAVSEGLVVLDAALAVQSANRAFYDLFRLAAEDCQGRPLAALGEGLWNGAGLRAALERILLEGERLSDFELEGDFPRIGIRMLRLNARPIIPSGNGRPLILLTVADVTAHRTAERDVRISEVRFRRLFESALDGVLIADPATGRILDANPSAAALLGKTHSELVGQDLQETGLYADAPSVRAALDELRARGETRYPSRCLLLPGGQQRVVEMAGNLYRENGRDLIQWNLRDVSERRRAEERYRESAQRFQFMAESMPQKIATAGPDGVVTYFNRQWLEYTGASAQELLSTGWARYIHPDDEQETARLWQRAVATGRAFEGEHRLRRKDGVYRWHLSRASAACDPSGAVVIWIGSTTDIDEQRRAQAKLEASVADRTAELKDIIGELETFSYTMAHDLRGPLRTMQGYANILKEDYSEKLDESGRRFVGQIASAADRMHKLVTDVLTFTRLTGTALALDPVALGPLLDTVIEQYPVLKDARIRVGGDLPCVMGNAAALTQAISNLLTNAVKFMPPGRAAEVEVRAEEDDEWGTLFIADNGLGIPTQDQQRIFRMFERALGTEHFEGTGMGLAIVRRTVERMGGTVGVKSRPGEGSTFWVRLRRARLL